MPNSTSTASPRHAKLYPNACAIAPNSVGATKAEKKMAVSATPSALPECSSPPISAIPITATPNHPSTLKPSSAASAHASQNGVCVEKSETQKTHADPMTQTTANGSERLP